MTPAAGSRAQNTLTVSNTTTRVPVGTVINLTTSGGSGGGSVTFTVTGKGCSMTGVYLRATSVGRCIVTAKKAESPGYLDATTVVKVFTFTKAGP